jgi:hypothetical protein
LQTDSLDRLGKLKTHTGKKDHLNNGRNYRGVSLGIYWEFYIILALANKSLLSAFVVGMDNFLN